MFTEKQIEALTAKLDASNVRQRTQGGRQVDYIEAWHATAEANRIFGFDGWSSRTIWRQLVAEYQEEHNGRKRWRVSYAWEVELTVYAGDRILSNTGSGAGHGIDNELGAAHESALKEAESDAFKRACKKYGNPFGLALYDKSRVNVETGEAQVETTAQAPARTPSRAVTPTNAVGSKPCTAKQANYAKALLRKRYAGKEDAYMLEQVGKLLGHPVSRIEALTMDEAKRLIDGLLAAAPSEPPASSDPLVNLCLAASLPVRDGSIVDLDEDAAIAIGFEPGEVELRVLRPGLRHDLEQHLKLRLA